MAATTTDCRILMYDLRTRLRTAEWSMQDKLTSINFSADGSELVGTYPLKVTVGDR